MTVSSSRLTCCFAAAMLACVFASSPALAVPVITDGFGDGDVNNDLIIDDLDTDVGGTPPLGPPDTWVPARLQDPMGDGFSIPEISGPEAGEEGDTGIRWLQMRGFTGGTTSPPTAGSGNSKPTLRIVSDNAGDMQETKAIGTEGGLGIDAIDSGHALWWESRGGGSSAAGFFDQTIALGTEVGDEVKVSFDFRVTRDASNANGGTPNNTPSLGELRFGLFQDTDSQLGLTNPFAGRQTDDGFGFLMDNPAIWGQEEGAFEGFLTGGKGAGDDVGANGDNGWTASVFMGNALVPNGGGSRIREELQADRILQGSDVHTIAQPEDINPDPFIDEFDFINLDISRVYNLSLSLVRATEVDPGDTITATLTVTDKLTGVQDSFSGTETLADSTSGGIPIPGTGGIQSDSWDYFAIRNASSGAGEFDFLLDNFVVDVSSANPGIPGDFDGDGDVDVDDFGVFVNSFQLSPQGGPPYADGDFDEDGDVDVDDFGVFVNSFQMFPPPAVAVPEPGSVALLAFASLALATGRRRN